MDSTVRRTPSMTSPRLASMNATTSCAGGRAPRCSYVNREPSCGCSEAGDLVRGWRRGGCGGEVGMRLIGPLGGEHAVGDAAPEQAQCFGAGLAGRDELVVVSRVRLCGRARCLRA